MLAHFFFSILGNKLPRALSIQSSLLSSKLPFDVVVRPIIGFIDDDTPKGLLILVISGVLDDDASKGLLISMIGGVFDNDAPT